MDIARIFGELLREERIKKSITQEELSHLCELDRTYISLLERGKRQPSIKTLILLSNALDIKASTIIIELENRL